MINQTPLNWQAPDKELMQEILNRAADGVIGQGGFCTFDNRICVYRDDKGNACGMGHCFTDDDLARLKEFFGKDVDNLSDSYSNVLLAKQEVFGLVSKQVRTFSTAVQKAHDDSSHTRKGMSAFKRRIQKMATDYALTVPESAKF